MSKASLPNLSELPFSVKPKIGLQKGCPSFGHFPITLLLFALFTYHQGGVVLC